MREKRKFFKVREKSGKTLILSRSSFLLRFSSHMVPPKVKHRFVDFFAMVPRSLSKVNFKCINESFAFSSG